jgi:hypothetical protein
VYYIYFYILAYKQHNGDVSREKKSYCSFVSTHRNLYFLWAKLELLKALTSIRCYVNVISYNIAHPLDFNEECRNTILRNALISLMFIHFIYDLFNYHAVFQTLSNSSRYVATLQHCLRPQQKVALLINVIKDLCVQRR